MFLKFSRFPSRRILSGVRRLSSFWEWTTQTRPPWRSDMKEAAIVCSVFALTGSASVAVVRPALKHLIGLEGTFYDGPNSYRILSVVLVSPIYACVLLLTGTLAGRHLFFAAMSKRILSRFVPKSVGDKIVCPRRR